MFYKVTFTVYAGGAGCLLPDAVLPAEESIYAFSQGVYTLHLLHVPEAIITAPW